MSLADDTDLCYCGHVKDEHNPKNGTCEITGCVCACFEKDEDRVNA